MRRAIFKPVLLGALVIALLVVGSVTQRSLNKDRARLQLTAQLPLDNAPPALAFTTVALGGFRGLIANALWLRASELQEQEKFFELIQLADLITKLQPRFPTVWSFLSWNLAYNVSAPLALTLVRQSNGAYVFDSNTDPACVAIGGFFPLEGQLFGNPGGSPDRNFHFTYELHTEFTYDADGAQNFTFRGDDDVWVFIDGKMVIDLGGVHGAIEQLVELDRLGLEDGETYELAFFFAERHRTQSNFKITTNLVLETIEPPTVSAAYD